MTKQTWPAPAKINLMLNIIGQRADGYHELQTLFQFIDYCDALEFTVRDDDQINRHCEDFELSHDEDIIVRAAHMLREYYFLNNESDSRCLGVDIQLQKNIPMGAGLGGGSSDAATTLLALNFLWNLGLGLDELADLGLKLGADVPVFIRGHAAFAEGIGEKLSVFSPPECWYLVLIPPVHVSTKEVFSNRELTRDCSAIKLCDLSRHEWRNVCTPVVMKSYPMVSQAIDLIGNYSKACMSGTGASVFSSFETKVQADEVLHKIRQNHEIASWDSFVTRGLNQSPLHKKLESLTR